MLQEKRNTWPGGQAIVGIIDPQDWGGKDLDSPPGVSESGGGEINSPPRVSESGGGRFLADPQNRSSPPKTGGQIGLPPPKTGGQIGFPPPKLGVKTPKIFACGAIFLPPQPWGSARFEFLGGGSHSPPRIPPPGSQIMGVRFPPRGLRMWGGKVHSPPSFGGRTPSMPRPL